jgi:hypothetical protein
LDLFQPLVVSSPVFFGIVNISVFSATKQIGALFFSLAFLTASALVSKHVIQKYLLISAIGMATLFGSIEIDSIIYATYPPFGLVTISFMPIGSYLVFTGLFHSATVAARGIELRMEFYKSAMSQLNLLKTIGVTEMEEELLKSAKFIEIRVSSLVKDETPFVEELDREKIKEILRDVLTELYSKSD